jgi:choline dehydrogenase
MAGGRCRVLNVRRMGMSDRIYDYIIVGAGSAGCVLANRLSADPSVRVLLLEAGGRDSNPWIHIPMGFGKIFGSPQLTWPDVAAPSAGLDGREVALPYGRVLGGSSSVNGLLYIRGQREDYDHWRDLGNRGWGYDDLLPLFRRAEDHLAGADRWHGTGGPVGVSPQPRHPIADAWIASAGLLQHPANPDFNGDRQEGVGYYETTTRKGRRSSVAQAYLRPARGRANLDVVTDARARRIVVDQGRAVAVDYDLGPAVLRASARREILLSAGAVGSPHLLQLSGIGDPEVLRSAGVAPLVDSAGVGRNLQDHVRVAAVFRASKAITFNDEYNRLWRRVRMGLAYGFFRKGPLTGGAGLVGAFLRSGPEAISPDLQVILQLFSWEGRGLRLHRFSGFATQVADLRPASRGTIDLVSADPRDRPRIAPNYLSHEDDLRKLVEGLRILRGIAAQAPIGAFIDSEIQPGPAAVSDEELAAYCRASAVTTFHMAGTCRMGADSGSVVDPELRVRGVEGLRVVDASIMPRVVAGNTNAPVIAIAEKASDLIMGG